MKKIAFCIDSLQIGGAEVLLVDILNNIPNNYEIHLLFFINKTDLISRIRVPLQMKLIDSKSNCEKIIRTRKYLKKNKIDFCFSHLENSNKVVALATFLLHTRSITVIHSVNIYEHQSLKEKIAYFIYNYLVDNIVAISDSVKFYLIEDLKLKPNKVKLIKNGIDFKRISINKNKLISENKTIFFTLGRLVKEKGYDFLIRTLGDSEIKHKLWSLNIIGDGDQRKILENLICEYGLSEKVSIIGKHENPFSFINAGNFALMPSRKEGLPIAALEILSQGIPILSSDIKSLNIIKDNFNGFRFNNENKNDFKKAFLNVLKISRDNYNVLSKNSIISVKEYGIEKCVNSYLKLIN